MEKLGGEEQGGGGLNSLELLYLACAIHVSRNSSMMRLCRSIQAHHIIFASHNKRCYAV
jgi:hypothetical protein